MPTWKNLLRALAILSKVVFLGGKCLGANFRGAIVSGAIVRIPRHSESNRCKTIAMFSPFWHRAFCHRTFRLKHFLTEVDRWSEGSLVRRVVGPKKVVDPKLRCYGAILSLMISEFSSMIVKVFCENCADIIFLWSYEIEWSSHPISSLEPQNVSILILSRWKC